MTSDGGRPAIAEISELARAAGLRRIHVLAWRDLALSLIHI